MFRKSPIAFAALVACGSLPLAAEAAPSVSWTAPVAGATLRGTVSGSACAVNTSGTTRVTFWANNWQINNDYSAPFNCAFDTTRLSDGAYTLRAVAYDASGASRESRVSVTVANKTSGTTSTSPTTSTPTTSTPTTTSPTTTSPTTSTPTTSTATPAPGSGALDVWFKAPLAGSTVKGVLNGGTACYVRGTGVSRVQFFLDSTALNTDTAMADGMQCMLDTTKFANGTHQLKATAYDSSGRSRMDVISINVQNPVATAPVTTAPVTTTPSTGTTSTATPAPGTGALDVWFKAPLAGSTVKGVLNGGTACYVRGTGVSRVQFFLDSTALNTDTTMADGMQCALDTTKFANGTHQLKATAYDSSGRSRMDVISINIQNAASATAPSTTTPSTTTPSTTTPTTTTPTTGTTSPTPTSSLPANGARAVTTFESIGLYWTPPANPGAAGCTVQFRKGGESAFRQGLNLWYDSRNNECRGSLVQLEPATAYEVQLGLPNQSPTAGIVATTWDERFPVAQVITLPAGTLTQPLAITQGGSASGYVLYQAAPEGTTIDVQNAYDSNVTISAPYVIVRGLALKGARRDAIDLQKGARDVVIEANDISGWGRYSSTNSAGWQIGVDMDSAVRARCTDLSLERVVIQRNRIHDPRYGANSWSWGHPAGPQGVTFSYCGGNHVIRYNEITSSDPKRYYNDGIGGEDNFTATGFPLADTDIYGNIIAGAWDDGIEAEGGNRNNRIWGNYLDRTGTGIASTVVHHGPLYIFRNVYNTSRKRSESSLDADDRGPFFKAGASSSYGNGRRYVFHNTALQAPNPNGSYPLGAGIGLAGNSGQPLTNTVSRNNIFHIWKPNWMSVDQTSGGYGNDVNYDLFNGSVNAGTGAEANGVKIAPTYVPGHGAASGSGGQYQLAPGTPGSGTATRLPNFNDAHATPDVGAHQSGTAAMKFGVNATR